MILAILQARFSSTRLPGKVLKSILGKPMLAIQIERIKRSQLIDKLVIATSNQSTDDAIASLANKIKVNCFRGSLNDVLDRFYQIAFKLNPSHIVRLTGDCPLIDPKLIDQIIKYHLEHDFDYTTNAIEATYPDGLDVEIFTFKALKEAWEEAKLPSQREHVTPFINRQPKRYNIHHYKNDQDLSALRWTVDEPLDFELVTRIYEGLYPQNPQFTTQDVLNFLELNPELKTLNTCHKRNEGYQKSLFADQKLIP